MLDYLYLAVLQSTHELKLGSNPLDDDLRKISH